MNVQFVDWGALLALLSLLGGALGLSATFLWRMMAKQTKDMNQRFDKQDRDMNRRFDQQDRRFDQHDGRFDQHDGRFDKQTKDMNRRFDKQDGDMAELRSDVAELSTDMAVVKNDLGHVKNGLGHLRSRWDRMDTNIVQIMRDLGRLEGEQRSSAPKEKIGADG